MLRIVRQTVAMENNSHEIQGVKGFKTKINQDPKVEGSNKEMRLSCLLTL